MASITPNLSLRKPTVNDRVDVELDLAENFDKLDAHAHSGTYVAVAHTGTFFWRAASPGDAVTAKPNGDGRSGVFDIKHEDSTGYLFHMVMGSNSGVGTAALGIGTDQGSGGGILVSAKNAGVGLSLEHNPSSSGAGLNINAYSAANFGFRFDQYVGAKAAIFVAQSAAGFGDGVTTSGSATLTSATAAFTVADVGATVAQLTTTATAPAAIPAGTTISAYVSATQVTMSANATASATVLNFSVSGRGIGATTPTITQYQGLTAAQKLLQAQIAGDTTFRFRLNIGGGMDWGAGGSSATDVNLFRETNGRLGTDKQFHAADGVATAVVAGAVSDASFLRTPPDGQIALDSSNSRLYARIGGAWKTVGLGAAALYVDLTSTQSIAGAKTFTDNMVLNNATLSYNGASGRLIGIAAASFQTMYQSSVSGDANAKFTIKEHGGMDWGAGSAAVDVNLYRATNGRLGTDKQFLAVDGLATKVVAGTVSDASFLRTPPDGQIALDSSGSKIWVRMSGAWKSVAVA